MAQEKPSRLLELVHLLRKQGPLARQHAVELLAAVQENPRLIWEVAAVRYATYLVAGLILAWGVSAIAHSFAPPLPPGAKTLATTADFHVICSRPECGEHFVIHRPFGFHDFPVPCPKCKQTSGQPARRCSSEKCNGRWVLPAKSDAGSVCPICGRRFDR